MNKARAKSSKPDSKSDGKEKTPPPDGTRETIESIAMAIVLALIFRSFVAEAFVIPTGSMAPTLVGRHKDVYCSECGYRYQAGASGEVTKEGAPKGVFVVATTCPLCRQPMMLDLFNKPNDDSFSGDRIIVGKFAYDFAEPERWDVIVFKFPGYAKDNYIKRLIGLPGETIRIVGGNIYARPKGEQEFRIARKPPNKLEALLQPVYDSKYVSPKLRAVHWPEAWYPADAGGWEIIDDSHRFKVAAGDEYRWLRYRHVVPYAKDWDELNADKVPARMSTLPPELVTDAYAYNASLSIFKTDHKLKPGDYNPEDSPYKIRDGDVDHPDAFGIHWVDDLAIDAEIDVQSSAGEFVLELIRGGTHYQCAIDVATGQARFSIVAPDGSDVPFVADAADATEVLHPVAVTNIKGPGKHRLRLSNIDHELLLWIDGKVVATDAPTTYASAELLTPHWTPQDPGDAEPAGIAARGMTLAVDRLVLSRDKYYIALKQDDGRGSLSEYRENPPNEGQLLSNPQTWADTTWFLSRHAVEFDIADDGYFPLGDNSPQSQDARVWANTSRTSPYDNQIADPLPHYVHKDLMVGKALLIYWPHSWNRPYLWPNFSRMKWIR